MEEAAALFEKLPQETLDKLVLIGGQALLVWTELYLIDKLTGYQFECVASDDIDFLASKATIAACAICWNGQPKYPSMEDSTPNSGIILLNEGTEQKSVEFLQQVYGIRSDEVHRYADVLNFPTSSEPKLVKVLSPPLCLKSRISNLYGLHYVDRKKDREVVRIKIAIQSCYWYLNSLAHSGAVRELQRATNYILKKVINTRVGRYISRKYEIDFSETFPKSIEGVSPDTYNKLIKIQLSKHVKKTSSNSKIGELNG